MKSDSYFIPLTKINPKWIKDMNIRTDSIKLLEENIGKYSLTLLGNEYLNVIPKAQK